MFGGVETVEISKQPGLLDVSEEFPISHVIVVVMEAEVSVVIVESSVEGRVFFEVIAHIEDLLAGTSNLLHHGKTTGRSSGYLMATTQWSISLRWIRNLARAACNLKVEAFLMLLLFMELEELSNRFITSTSNHPK